VGHSTFLADRLTSFLLQSGGIEPCTQLKQLHILLNLCTKASPTSFHKALAALSRRGQIRRIYSQNVDGLEAKVGLSVFPFTCTSPTDAQVIALHGSICHLTKVSTKCCHSGYHPVTQEADATLARGFYPKCPLCESNENTHTRRNKGLLRPAVLFHDQHSLFGDQLAVTVQKDQKALDLLVIVGTSLNAAFPGLEAVVKTLSHTARCLVIDPHMTKLPRSLNNMKQKPVLVSGDCQRVADGILRAIPGSVY
jgi:NAD+-dependent protein deacetylase SIR2